MKEVGRLALGRPPTIEAPRDTILAQAARLFAENGYEQSSLQDVADAVGVSKAAVYHYFPSKKDIYHEIVISLLDGLYEHVSGNLDSAVPVEEQVGTFMRLHAEYFDRNYVAFVTLLHGVSGTNAEMRSEREVAVRDRYECLLRGILSQGTHTGQLAALDPALAGRAILSMLNWMARWYRPGGSMSATEIAGQYHALLYQGLEPRQ